LGCITDTIRHERHRFHPARRIPQKWNLLLEALYEPQFSDRLHGYPSRRLPHSASTACPSMINSRSPADKDAQCPMIDDVHTDIDHNDRVDTDLITLRAALYSPRRGASSEIEEITGVRSDLKVH
jgi:hypothetical protein